MQLTLVYITNEQITKEEPLKSSLAEAKELADLHLDEGLAERIDILDQFGLRVGQRPRLLRGAEATPK